MAEDWEERLIADLARLRREPPFRVDVTARVMAEVRRLGPPPLPAAISPRALAWGSAAVLLLAAGLAVLTVSGLPGLAATIGRGAGEAADLGGTALSLVAAAVTLLARGIGETADFLSSFRGLTAVLAPLAVSALAAALVGMAGITSYVVGRDLRQGRSEAM